MQIKTHIYKMIFNLLKKTPEDSINTQFSTNWGKINKIKYISVMFLSAGRDAHSENRLVLIGTY